MCTALAAMHSYNLCSSWYRSDCRCVVLLACVGGLTSLACACAYQGFLFLFLLAPACPLLRLFATLPIHCVLGSWLGPRAWQFMRTLMRPVLSCSRYIDVRISSLSFPRTTQSHQLGTDYTKTCVPIHPALIVCHNTHGTDTPKVESF